MTAIDCQAHTDQIVIKMQHHLISQFNSSVSHCCEFVIRTSVLDEWVVPAFYTETIAGALSLLCRRLWILHLWTRISKSPWNVTSMIQLLLFMIRQQLSWSWLMTWFFPSCSTLSLLHIETDSVRSRKQWKHIGGPAFIYLDSRSNIQSWAPKLWYTQNSNKDRSGAPNVRCKAFHPQNFH